MTVQERRRFIPWKERPELCDRLRELWADNTITTMQIAATLGFPFEKNAIIGKAHRMGLPLRANPALTGEANSRWTGGRKIRDQRYRAKRKLKLIELELPQEDVMTDHPNGVSFIEHTFEQCKWPLTEGPRTIGMDAFRFCGKPRMENCPYCKKHQRMSRVPGTARGAMRYAWAA